MRYRIPLISKATDALVDIEKVDKEIWAFFNQVPDPSGCSCYGWYDCIGWIVHAYGVNIQNKGMEERIEDWFKDFDDDQECIPEKYIPRYQNILIILEYLRENYRSTAWAGVTLLYSDVLA